MSAYGYARIMRVEDRKYRKPETKITEIMDYSAVNGITLKGVYVDDRCSGLTKDRPELNRIIRLVQAGELDILICADQTSLGIDPAVTDGLSRYLADHGVRLLYVS